MKTFKKKIQLHSKFVGTFFLISLNHLEITDTCEIYVLIKNILNVLDIIYLHYEI